MTKILPLQLPLKNDHQKLSKNPGIFDFRHFQNFLQGSALHFHSVPPHMDRFPPHFDHFFCQKVDLALFGDLGQTSQQKSGIWSETQESWDVCRNSSKSGETHFLVCFSAMRCEHVSIYCPQKKTKSHFSKNWDKRPSRSRWFDLKRKNPGTFVEIP